MFMPRAPTPYSSTAWHGQHMMTKPSIFKRCKNMVTLRQWQNKKDCCHSKFKSYSTSPVFSLKMRKKCKDVCHIDREQPEETSIKGLLEYGRVQKILQKHERAYAISKGTSYNQKKDQ
jgi:hypothetical protein